MLQLPPHEALPCSWTKTSRMKHATDNHIAQNLRLFSSRPLSYSSPRTTLRPYFAPIPMTMRLGLATRALGVFCPRVIVRNVNAAARGAGDSLSRRRNSDSSGSSRNCNNSVVAVKSSCQVNSNTGTGKRRFSSSTTTSNVGLPVPLPFEDTK